MNKALPRKVGSYKQRLALFLSILAGIWAILSFLKDLLPNILFVSKLLKLIIRVYHQCRDWLLDGLVSTLNDLGLQLPYLPNELKDALVLASAIFCALNVEAYIRYKTFFLPLLFSHLYRRWADHVNLVRIRYIKKGSPVMSDQPTTHELFDQKHPAAALATKLFNYIFLVGFLALLTYLLYSILTSDRPTGERVGLAAVLLIGIPSVVLLPILFVTVGERLVYMIKPRYPFSTVPKPFLLRFRKISSDTAFLFFYTISWPSKILSDIMYSISTASAISWRSILIVVSAVLGIEVLDLFFYVVADPMVADPPKWYLELISQ